MKYIPGTKLTCNASPDIIFVYAIAVLGYRLILGGEQGRRGGEDSTGGSGNNEGSSNLDISGIDDERPAQTRSAAQPAMAAARRAGENTVAPYIIGTEAQSVRFSIRPGERNGAYPNSTSVGRRMRRGERRVAAAATGAASNGCDGDRSESDSLLFR